MQFWCNSRNITNLLRVKSRILQLSSYKFQPVVFGSFRLISGEYGSFPDHEHVLRGKIFSFVPAVNLHQQFVKEISFEDIRLRKHLEVVLQTFNFAKERYQNGHEQEKDQFQRTIFELQPLVIVMEELEKIKVEIKDLDILISDLEKQDEKEFLELAREDRKVAQDNLEMCKEKIMHLVLPVDDIDDRDIVMELSAGVGGQEAMLFVKDLYQMYCGFANYKGWKCETLMYDATDIGGLRQAHLSISGLGAYRMLKLESGVHRVQRVPKTEKTGRIHTSTATVAVLPQPNEIDVVIEPHNLSIEFKRSSGAGGQHVNKTDSCVRITHIPTGIIVECQMERCQHRNRALALTALRAKLYQRELDGIIQSNEKNRKIQVGTAGRSEKVRTYNFAQNRVTDHRLHQSVFHIEEFFHGTEKLDYFIENLKWWWSVQLLHELLRKYD